jgi:hypothetical protein
MFLLATVVRGADATLWITGEEVLPLPVRWAATDQATKMFAAIGVRLKWKTHHRADPDDAMAIQLRFIANMPGHPGAMAFAAPFEAVPVVTVMYDRIRFNTERVPEVRAALLAHVLAHEIGHVLMKTDGHSAAGIMKTHWSGIECQGMAHRPLAFLPDDADMIRRALGLSALPR